MLVEIEHHYGWTLHDIPEATTLADAAYLAVRQTHDFLTDANHRRDPGGKGDEQQGSIWIRRTHDAEPIANPVLQRMADFWGGNRAGELWFSVHYRTHHPHGTLAVDDFGRRWAFVTIDDDYPAQRTGRPWRDVGRSQWRCLSDPREKRDTGPASWGCCGKAPGQCRCGGVWQVGGRATDDELRQARVLWLEDGLVYFAAKVEAGYYTPTQAAQAGGYGRGQDGRDSMNFRIWRLLRALEGHPVSWPDGGPSPWDVWRAEAPDPEQIRARLIDLVGLRSAVNVERASLRKPVWPKAHRT